MTTRIGVAGATGYVGGELLRLLAAHPEVEIGVVAAKSSAGTLLGAHHPHLVGLADRKIEVTTPEMFDDHDVVFMALPHGESASLANTLGDNALVVDCGADFRLTDTADWDQFYGGEHAGTWPYGLPELPGARPKLIGARRIAVPGCYPTVSTLAIAPAVANGFVDSEIVVVAASGTSGAGRNPKVNLLGTETMGAMSAYGVGGVHRHTPEIRQNLRSLSDSDITVSFTPMLAPMSRGILATVSASLEGAPSIAEVRAAYEQMYASEQFVSVLPDGQWPSTAVTLGSNSVHIQMAIDSNTNRLVAVGAMDNLTKGAAGAAVQSMNIAMGWDEALGLTAIGMAP